MKVYPILIGGFGNRLYQIANSLRIGKQHNCDVVFSDVIASQNDVSSFRHLVIRPSDFDDFGGHNLAKNDFLPNTVREIFPNLSWQNSKINLSELISNKKVYFEKDITNIDISKDSVIMGYFFGYSFVEENVNFLKKSFNPKIENYIFEKYNNLYTKKILGIHLRLGIESDNNPAIFVPYKFYQDIINEQINDFEEIYILSDNIVKSKEFIKHLDLKEKRITFIFDEPMYIDMLILSKCSTLLIAPSTLSAWSAYLNDSENIFVPSIWPKHHWTNDIPKKWKLR